MKWSDWLIIATLSTLAALTNALLGDALTDRRASVVVNSLEFEMTEDGPVIHQNRVVTGRRAVYAVYQARVRGRNGGRVCFGEGHWPYTTGQLIATIAFDDWVEDAGCWDRLPSGTYQACAEYFVADNEPTEQCSLGFVKK